MEPHVLALNKAKICLMGKADSVFFTTVCFSMKHIFDDSIPTACTNGKVIRFNPKFFMELNIEEQVFLLLHESLHVAYMHVDSTRRAQRCPKKWNQAGDHVINLQLIARDFRMPSGKNAGLADPQYIGMSTEEVYKLLPEPPPGEPIDMDIQESTEPPEQLQHDIQDILVRAAMQSKMYGDKAGTIPGDIQIFLDRLLNPKLPAKRILQKYLQTFAKNDYSFKKPNRRFFPKHYLPSLQGEGLISLAMAVDSSGSVTDEEFNQYVSDIHNMLRMFKPEKMTLLQFDTEIRSVDQIKDVNELMKVKFTGRGGTYIQPVLEWAEVNKPQVLLIFTDGHFRFYQNECKRDIVWLINDNPGFKAPFGKVINYSTQENT